MSQPCPGSTPNAALPTVQLVLPRNLLAPQQYRVTWAPARTSPPTPAGSAPRGTLAHGPLHLQPVGALTLALVPRLQDGPLQRLPVQARPWPHPGSRTMTAPSGLALVYQPAAGEACPSGASAWEGWLARNAPEYRLACAALVPDVAVLWWPAEGPPQAWLRCGDAWAALQGPAAARPSPASPWRPIQHLALPGARMHDTRRDALPLTAQAANDETVAVEADVPVRHSRQAAALGAPVLGRLQRSLWVVVGCDTTGSLLAHSLARMGVNLQVLDPATMAAHSLDADLPPLHEGQPKPVALQHLLRGLLRPGTRCDARALTIASPAAGSLLASADGLLCCTTNPEARDWANAWSQAMLKPLLAVRTGRGPAGCQAELQLALPGLGCLRCGPRPLRGVPADVGRAGQATPRSWQGVATHAALRMLENLYDGRLSQPLLRQLVETADGSLEVRDLLAPGGGSTGCDACTPLAGRGLPLVLRVMSQAPRRRAA